MHNISDLARFFVGGLIEHSCAITAVANPLINSYKRLVSGFEVPSLHHLVRTQPLLAHPHSRRAPPPGSSSARRIPMQSLPNIRRHPGSGTGWNQERYPGEPVDLNVYHLTPAERGCQRH